MTSHLIQIGLQISKISIVSNGSLLFLLRKRFGVGENLHIKAFEDEVEQMRQQLLSGEGGGGGGGGGGKAACEYNEHRSQQGESPSSPSNNNGNGGANINTNTTSFLRISTNDGVLMPLHLMFRQLTLANFCTLFSKSDERRPIK